MISSSPPHSLWISGRLHFVGDTVYIPEYKYNGTILRFTSRFVVVYPHDYGHPIRRLPSKLRIGEGISRWHQMYMDENDIFYNNNIKIQQGIFPAIGRPGHLRQFDPKSAT